MATEIRVPAIATAGAKLSIGRWFKRTGDAVSSDEPIVEIEADNVTLEIRSPISGVLTSVYMKDGAYVEIGAVLGAISQF
ncbi:MAG: biotin/lipoyl-binding protein [Candidatus Dormibacteraeota bacterium]|nr:biotin/lipoyl-binding protein [Candidatus Dormibacteraeota bacterium]